VLGTSAGACGAGQRAYLLPFAVGQNDFDVFITTPAAISTQVRLPFLTKSFPTCPISTVVLSGPTTWCPAVLC
jgi:hypothetical protein